MPKNTDSEPVSRHREIQVAAPSPPEPRFDLDRLIRAWETYLASDYAESTRRAYVKGLRLFRDWLAAQGLTLASALPSSMRAFRDSLKEAYSTQSVNLWLSAVRRFYDFIITEFDAPILSPAASVRGVSRRGKSRRHKRDELTADEVRALFATCNGTVLDKRDKAILALMSYCALRTVEVCRADLTDLQTRDGRRVLWVSGKGHTEADDFVVLPTAAEEALRAWLRARGRTQGALFWSLSRQNYMDRLTTRAVRGMVKQRMEQAGIIGDAKSTHSLRHSAISQAIRGGAEPLQVQAMARHRSYDTTLGYYHELSRTENPAEDLIQY